MTREYEFVLQVEDPETDDQVITIAALSLESLQEQFYKIEMAIGKHESKIQEEQDSLAQEKAEADKEAKEEINK